MHYRIAALTLGFAVLAAACTTANGTPATAPSVPETAPPTTTTLPTTLPTTTSTVPATTTTVDRLTEIQAIYQDLENRRVQALWSGDEKSFSSLFVDTPYKEESLRALDLVEPGTPPVLVIEVLEILTDGPDCLVFVELSTVNESSGSPDQRTVTLQPLGEGWGYAYVSEDPGGWQCTEPHPLSG